METARMLTGVERAAKYIEGIETRLTMLKGMVAGGDDLADVLDALVDIDEAIVLIVDGEYGDGGTIKLTH